MRLDERPYVKVKEDRISKTDDQDPDGLGEYEGIFDLVASGRTPATLLSWNIRCGLTRANRLTALNVAGDFLGDFNRATNTLAVVNNSDSLAAICPFHKADYLNSTSEENEDFTDDQSLLMTFLIDVRYSDVFQVKHRTTQCFYIQKYGPSPIGKRFLSCRKFPPAIE